ncbi:MAG TPA: glycoside hydrolase family 16 protein [Polyangia bacterium]|nr:glycoside hydrolase family 16 protein [Polyangia bacterium]
MIHLTAVIAAALWLEAGADAATLAWKGHTWQLTSGGMAGVCQGDPKNVTADANGYLHLRISDGTSGWTASELFTTDRLGFGTYQWQVDGPIDSYDKNVVLGLFPYGPAAGIGADGTNEIDIEYSRWGQASGPNGDWTDYPASGTTIGELSYTFSLAPATLSTSRFVWSANSITSALLSGLQPVDGTTGLVKSWTYAPANPTINVPQQALPLGMNLWCFDSPPSDGNPVEIVIRDFIFVPAGGAGGAGTAGAAGAGSAGSGGIGGQAGGSGGIGGRAGGSGAIGGPTGTTGAGGGAGAPGLTGGMDGHGGASGSTGSGAGASGTGGTGGAPGTTGQSGSTGTAADSGSSSGCACAVYGADAPWPVTVFWSLIVLSLLSQRVRRSHRGNGTATIAA